MEKEELLAIIRPSESSIKSISEEVFVKKWLPMFYGSWKAEDGSVPIATWITQVAKSHMVPVIVKRNGKEIFRVPPLFKDVMLDPEKDQGRSTIRMRQALDIRNAYNSRMPGSGDKYLNSWVDSIGEVNPDQNDYREKFWIACFLDYGFLTLQDLGIEEKTDNEGIEEDEDSGTSFDFEDDADW